MRFVRFACSCLLAASIGAQGVGSSAAPLVAAPSAPGAPAPAQSVPVPEPSTLLLVGTGLVGFALTARLRQRRRAK